MKDQKNNPVLLVVGDDKLGRRLIHHLNENHLAPDLLIDRSTNFKRVLRLLRKRSIGLSLLIKMAFAEYRRKDHKVENQEGIKSNAELQRLAQDKRYEKIYLFRAGLIINKNIISSGVQILNVHCASIPEYGGIGSIDRALKNRDLNQNATLYFITAKIDDGEIVATKQYVMDSSKSFLQNEDIAYEAGIQLLIDELKTINGL